MCSSRGDLKSLPGWEAKLLFRKNFNLTSQPERLQDQNKPILNYYFRHYIKKF
jgi:hypothetical protein